MNRTVGILGGMGPLSTVELMQLIIKQTPVTREQEHIRMLVDNRPQIPDRTDFLLGHGESPLPMLQESASQLQSWGADFLAIACNTAHAFYREIRSSVSIPVLNMLELLKMKMKESLPPGSPVLLLTTSGALQIRLFDPYLADFRMVIPAPDLQRDYLTPAIYGKAGIKTTSNLTENRDIIIEVIRRSTITGMQAVVAGCTEIGLGLRDTELDLHIFNPLDALAGEIVRLATG